MLHVAERFSLHALRGSNQESAAVLNLKAKVNFVFVHMLNANERYGIALLIASWLWWGSFRAVFQEAEKKRGNFDLNRNNARRSLVRK